MCSARLTEGRSGVVAHGVKAYYPTIRTTKTIKRQSVTIEESRLPNLFFAYGTEAEERFSRTV